MDYLTAGDQSGFWLIIGIGFLMYLFIRFVPQKREKNPLPIPGVTIGYFSDIYKFYTKE